MNKICLAIGDDRVEKWLKEKLEGRYEFTKSCIYRGMILTVVKENQPDILVLSSALPGGTERKARPLIDIIDEIRIAHTYCRIILLVGDCEESAEFLDAAVGDGVYDIVTASKGENLHITDVIQMIETPCDFKFASKYRLERGGLLIEDKQETDNGLTFVEEVEEPSKKKKKKDAPVKPKVLPEPVVTEDAPGKLQVLTADMKPEGLVDEKENGEPETSVLYAEETTVLKAPAFAFRELSDEEFYALTGYANQNIPGPDSYDGEHQRKDILYGNAYNTYPAKQGKLIVFAGVKQGMGCTTTAINMAAHLAKQGKTLLIDYVYGMPEVFEKLRLPVNSITLEYAAAQGGALTVTHSALVAGAGTEAQRISGLPEDLDLISLSAGADRNTVIQNIDGYMENIRAVYDYIVVDMNISVNSVSDIYILQKADKMFFVSTQDINALAYTARMSDMYKYTAPGLILTRTHAKVHPGVAEVRSMYRFTSVYEIEEDSIYMEAANNFIPCIMKPGTLFAPNRTWVVYKMIADEI